MAKAGAWGAAGGTLLGQSRALKGSSDREAGHRLIAAEPLLRRAIPVLILLLLIVIVLARAASLISLRDNDDLHARSVLALSAMQLAGATPLGGVEFDEAAMISRVRERALLPTSYALLLLDKAYVVTAVNSGEQQWLGQSFNAIATEAEPLFTFGADAGAVEVNIAGAPWLAATALNSDGSRAAIVMAPQSSIFANWMAKPCSGSILLLCAGVAACGTGTWPEGGCIGRAPCTTCLVTPRATPSFPSATSAI
jgi:two-component system cell cycle sensor histidine kinase PleC